jgi:thiamine-phosphate pyrophosphorylase
MSSPVYRILDASLNRAGEGLRVVEDYVRFVLDDPLLTSLAKTLRHDFAALAAAVPAVDRHAARNTLEDVGTDISTDSEQSRGDAWDVCVASLKRVQQSLRSLEEYGKIISGDFAGRAESLRYRLYTLEKVIDTGRCSQERLKHTSLCVLADGCGSSAAFERLVTQFVKAGVGMIQLRDKTLDDRELVERARHLVALTRNRPDDSGHAVTLAIVNDRPDIAAAVHADGVHLGQEDLCVKDARAIVGTRMLIGVSTHNIEQARAALMDGANYLGAGPTFPSSTKNFDAFAGLEFLRQAAAEIRLPTFAIGGITAGNLREVLAAGITRVAVGAAITTADNPGFAACEILDMLRTGVSKPRSPIAAV